MSEFVPVLKTTDLAPGEGTVVEVGDNLIAVFNVDGSFYAVDNTCPHAGGPLGEGFLDEQIVYCPWHDWCFDVTTGISPEFGAEVACYPVRVEGNDVLVGVDPSPTGG